MVGTPATNTPENSHYGEERVELFSCKSFVWNHIAVTSTVFPWPPPLAKVMDMTSFVDRLYNKMSEIACSPAEKNRRDREYMPKLLKSYTSMFIRDTAMSHSLQTPYRGPYKIVTKNDKYHTILIEDILQTIPINRFGSKNWLNSTHEKLFLQIAPPPLH